MWNKLSLLKLFPKPIHVYHRKNRTWGLSLKLQTDWLVQERRNSIAKALELRLSCTNPSRCPCTELSYQRAWTRRPYDECKVTHDAFEFSLTCHIRVTLSHERHGVSDRRQLDRLFHGLFKLTTKGNIEALHNWPFVKESPGDRGIPLTNG